MWRTKEALLYERVEQRPKTPNTNVTLAGAFDLLQECEREWNTAEVGLRENIQIRLECSSPAITTFRQYHRAALNEILGNICLLHGEWIRHDSSNCTNLAVYSVTSPEVLWGAGMAQ